MPSTLIDKARKIKMLLLDVDGVMTNGQFLLMPDGEEVKSFSIHDGFGIVMAMKAGIRIGIVSGRASTSVKLRCEELHIKDVYIGTMDKLPVLQEILERHQLTYEEIAYIGDDVPDLPVLERVGFSAAPQNAHGEVKRRVDLVLKKAGGEGAVRELIDFLLMAQKKQGKILAQFSAKRL